MQHPKNRSYDLPETLPYSFGLLTPERRPPVPDPHMQGIEVTDPSLAALCGLGNIDPQHTCDGSGKVLSAIEACCHTPLPPNGSRLVTIRPDLDALGAMAILTLRAFGWAVSSATADRIAMIARVDRYDRGPWPGPRPLPRSGAELINSWPGPELAQLGACMRDATLTVEQRVRNAIRWLKSGVAPPDFHDRIVSEHARLIRSLTLGTSVIETALGGQAAVVKSIYPGALDLGYRRAKIVVAINPAFVFNETTIGRKYTIARWSEDSIDLDRVATRLAKMEFGWGGQPGIKGSPQFRPSSLSLHQVLCVLRQSVE